LLVSVITHACIDLIEFGFFLPRHFCIGHV
jgi:hypothetical protein